MNITIQTLILALIPLIITPYVIAHAFSLGASLFHRMIQKLPAHQQVFLESLANKAVSSAEQKLNGMSGAEKKKSAETAFFALCQRYNIKEPSTTVVDALIEAAVAALPQALAMNIDDTQQLKAVAASAQKVPVQ